MRTMIFFGVLCPMLLLLILSFTDITEARAADSESIARGKYLVNQAGCNDCHSPGYAFSDGNTPEDSWLTGDAIGWRGPWGTTYSSNLRMIVTKLTQEQWLAHAKSLKTRPPMPWYNLNKMKDEDLRAIYQFIVYLGPAGDPAPAYVPPDQEPKTPYILFPSPPTQK